MLDGITSGLIDKYAFENQYNYIYDLGYIIHDDGKVVLVEKQDWMD